MAVDPDSLGYPVVDLPTSVLSSPTTAVTHLVDHLVQSGRIRPENAPSVASQVTRREALGSTAIGKGVALPHSKSDFVDQILVVVGRCEQPMNWPGSLDNAPVHMIVLLVTPASQPGPAMRALENLARRLRG